MAPGLRKRRSGAIVLEQRVGYVSVLMAANGSRCRVVANRLHAKRPLASHPRFHMHYTPTDSSWINQVERCSATSPTSSCNAPTTAASKHSRQTSDRPDGLLLALPATPGEEDSLAALDDQDDDEVA
jgi:hypothetical protein